MRPARLFVSVTLLSIATFAFAQTEPLPSQSDLDAITARGRLLYEYDQAAWHSTDAVMPMNLPKEKLGRYIVRKTDSGWEVAFGRLNQNRDAFEIAAFARQSTGPYEVQVTDPVVKDTGYYLRAAKAFELAVGQFHGANVQYNLAVVPAPDNNLFVYVIPAQTDANPHPLGADVRFLISGNGEKIIENRQMHKSLIPSRDGPVPAGASIVAGNHSHILSNLPEDSDVFYVLSFKPSLPEYIGTRIAVYVVNTDGSIRIVQKTKKR